MGQQQFLLIVLGVIVIGLSIAVGISIAATSSSQSNRDGVVSDLQNLASIARSHYYKPEALGGGGNTFRNFVIPSELDTTDNGTYEIRRINSTGTLIRLEGKGTSTGQDGSDPIHIRLTISIAESQYRELN